jgi:hypothetical protein
MTSLKDELKEKINWTQVDLVMVGFGCFSLWSKGEKNFKGQKTRRQSDGQWKSKLLEFSNNQEQEQQHFHLYGWTKSH